MSLRRSLKFIIDHPLNRQAKVAAVLRFIRWQVASRLSRGDRVHSWIDGVSFRVRHGEVGLTGNIYTGLHEYADMGFLLHLLRPDDLFVDVGANSGSYTLLACAGVGCAGVAFEPVPSTYQRLVANIELNGLQERVRCLNKGVGREPGRIAFTSGHDVINHVLCEGEQNDGIVEAEVTTLDEVLQGVAPRLLKIDVEGYETPVLEGAELTLGNDALWALIVELNGSGARYGFDEDAIFRQLHDFGFRTCSYDPLTRALTMLDGRNPQSGNTLFIRDPVRVTARIVSARRRRILGTVL